MKPTIHIDVDTTKAQRAIRPNRDLDQAGYSLQHVIAAQLTAALDHIARELNSLDGYGSGTPEVSVSASAELTAPERYADARWNLTCALDDLKDAKNELLACVRQMSEQCVRVMGMRAPRDVVKPPDRSGLCCSGQAGKHAYIEWADPLCMMPAIKSGLCQAHYMSWYRARKRDGIDVTKDHEPL